MKFCLPQSYHQTVILLQFDDVPPVLEVEPDIVDRDNAFGHGVNLDDDDGNS